MGVRTQAEHVCSRKAEKHVYDPANIPLVDLENLFPWEKEIDMHG